MTKHYVLLKNNSMQENSKLHHLLQLTVDYNASDLHLVVGHPPVVRIDGKLKAVPSESVLAPDTIKQLLDSSLKSEEIERLTVNKELDFSLPFSEKARFRVNAYTQKGSYAAAFRRIPIEIPHIDTLGLPKIVHSFSTLRQGLVLVTGPTGHGKSTTLAAVLNEINKERSEHIITIEDPIEFVFSPRKSMVSQREMGQDTHSWKVALKSVLREDPDVVLIGEMRDHETIAAALTIAETGHLVFATLHTNSASQTIDRIVDVFPEEQQVQVRLQLSNVIEAVFSQRLVPTIDGKRVVASEVMLGSSAVKTLVREGKTHQLDNVLQTSQEIGMNTIEMSLSDLIKKGEISLEVAQSFSLRPEALKRLVRGT